MKRREIEHGPVFWNPKAFKKAAFHLHLLVISGAPANTSDANTSCQHEKLKQNTTHPVYPRMGPKTAFFQQKWRFRTLHLLGGYN